MSQQANEWFGARGVGARSCGARREPLRSRPTSTDPTGGDLSQTKPKARSDLRIRQAFLPEGPCWTVEDRARRTTFWFGPDEMRVLGALDGETALADLPAAVGARSHETILQVETLVADLRRAGLLEDEYTPALLLAERLVHLAEDEGYWGQLDTRGFEQVVDALLALADTVAATSDCDDCHLSCCAYNVDVTEEETPALLSAAATLSLTEREVLETQTSEVGGRRVHRLCRRPADNLCVLVDEDGLCRVHRETGLESKPLVCQHYPAHVVLTPDGPRLTLRSGCAYPAKTRAPEAREGFRRLLERMIERMPQLPVPVAPDEVQVAAGAAPWPWRRYAAWEERAAETLEGAETALAGLREVAESLAAELPDRTLAPATGSASALAGGLASLFAQGGHTDEEAALLALARNGAPSHPRPCPPEIMARTLLSLYPIRFPTVLAGLGVLRFVAALVDHDPRAVERPRETAANWFRYLRASPIHLALVRSDLATLEALSTDPNL